MVKDNVLKKMLIFIADDDETNLKLIHTVLSQDGLAISKPSLLEK